MRYMGIDYGTKRVGIALSDESGSMAFPHTVLQNTGELLSAITALIEEEGVGHIVIGHSTDSAGNENPVQSAITEFMTDLTLEVGLPVDTIDERYTTQQAVREQGRNEMTDASAAALILESYLNRR